MADYYGTVAGYKAYHLARDNDVPVRTDDEILASLLVASEFIDNRIRSAFHCTFKTGGRLQVREFPRIGVVDMYGYVIGNAEVPREIESATYEAAWRQLVTPGGLMKDYTPGKYKQVSIDGALSVTYAGFGSASDVQTQFLAIDAILAPLLQGVFSPRSSYSGVAVRA